MKNGRQGQAGFTIVETLIVLAVAGLILLIVFLAVPNLQRSGRNNQRNQDAQIVLQAVSRWELNHAGGVPKTIQLRLFLSIYERNKLTFYRPADVTVNTPPATNASVSYPSSPIDLDSLLVNNRAKCVSGGTATNRGAGYSDVVALYAIETANGSSPHCQQL